MKHLNFNPSEIKDYLGKIKNDKTSYFIILHNLVPIFGVIFLDWDPIAIVYIYIAETIVIGFFNLFKILLAKKAIKQADGTYKNANFRTKLFMAVFFLLHYNAFNYGQIVIITSNIPGREFFSGELKYFIDYFIYNDGILLALGAIIFTHLFSFFYDYIRPKAYNVFSPLTLIFLPYGRIFLQQFVGLAGAFFVEFFGLPFFFLVILQLLKMAGELLTHLYIDKKFKEPIELAAMGTAD